MSSSRLCTGTVVCIHGHIEPPLLNLQYPHSHNNNNCWHRRPFNWYPFRTAVSNQNTIYITVVVPSGTAYIDINEPIWVALCEFTRKQYIPMISNPTVWFLSSNSSSSSSFIFFFLFLFFFSSMYFDSFLHLLPIQTFHSNINHTFLNGSNLNTFTSSTVFVTTSPSGFEWSCFHHYSNQPIIRIVIDIDLPSTLLVGDITN